LFYLFYYFSFIFTYLPILKMILEIMAEITFGFFPQKLVPFIFGIAANFTQI
jgi:hypothetical protein